MVKRVTIINIKAITIMSNHGITPALLQVLVEKANAILEKQGKTARISIHFHSDKATIRKDLGGRFITAISYGETIKNTHHRLVGILSGLEIDTI